MKLLDAISKRTSTIGVVGLGHVGLTAATVFADRGFSVLGCDLIPRLVKDIMSGNLERFEPDLAQMVDVAVKSGRLSAATDCLDTARSSDIIVVCVQTPLSEEQQPDLSYLRSACETVGKGLRRDRLVLIMSSVPPGTTTEISRILQRVSGLKCGKDFWLAHCPERLAPGNLIRDFVHSARVIGGLCAQSTRLASRLFKETVRGKLFVTDCFTAEIVKLAENTFRDVNIAFANELALICEEKGVDIEDVLNLANTHPRVKIHKPGCGVGGPCLPKDPHLLLAGTEQHTKDSVIRCSRRLNTYMESHTLSKIFTALQSAKKKLNPSKIGVLGVTYKKGSDDVTNSPAKSIIQKLLALGAQVKVYDPFSTETFGAKGCKDLYEAIDNTDCLVILTDHKEFASLDLKKVKEMMNKPAYIVDGRRVIDPAKAASIGIEYLGIGLGSRILLSRDLED